MAAGSIVQEVACIAGPVVSEAGFELVDVEFVREGPNRYLRIFIDKPGGITIDDCQAVSERLSVLLDKAEPVKQSYFLEVSSPGLDRPLKKESDFERYRGETVQLKLYKPQNGKKVFEGVLEGLKEGEICITDNEGQSLEFDRNDVAIVKRAVKL